MEIVADEGVRREVPDAPAATASLHYASPEALFRSAYAPLVRALSALAGPEDAEDAVQDAFVQLEAKWGTIRKYENPAAWVRRVAIHRLTDRHRRLRRGAAALLRLRPVETGLHPPPSDHLDLAAAVRLLPPRQQLAVALFYLADLPVREVAEAMGISEGAVHRHLHDGRGALRHLLGV